MNKPSQVMAVLCLLVFVAMIHLIEDSYWSEVATIGISIASFYMTWRKEE